MDVRRRILAPLLALLVLTAGGLAGGARPADAAGGFALDLYRPGDFVRQTNLVQCVGASMQMMANLAGTADDRTAATQLRLQAIARAYSDLISPRPGRRGASVWGWAAGLTVDGTGRYQVAGFPTLDDAVHTAAFRVTGVDVHDPLYPATSSTWGRSPAPGQRLSLAELGRQFVARRATGPWSSGLRNQSLGGPFVIVMPVPDPAASPGATAA
jgi:hypothetical protein